MFENYREPEDLLSDESFLSWYYHTGDERDMEWERWINANPESRDLADRAIEILRTTRFPEIEIPADQIRRAEASLKQKIEVAQPRKKTEIKNSSASSREQRSPLQPMITAETRTALESRIAPEERVASLPGNGQKSFFRNVYARQVWIAAAILLVLVTAGMFITKFLIPGKPELRTDFGQIKEHQLPDGTLVTMNANSNLRYSSVWKDGADREVWVNGEAYFHVRKTPMMSRFIVHTSRFDIVVTGTQFNVVNRRERVNVLLKEGSVVLRSRDGKELNLEPGDYAEYNSNNQLEKKAVRHETVLAWKEQKLVFDKTPLKELVTIINDQYGVRVKLADIQTGDKTISGILPNNNLEVLLKSLEATGDFEVLRPDGNGVTIRAHAP
ncbi:FecR family protein [Flavitalea flava]